MQVSEVSHSVADLNPLVVIGASSASLACPIANCRLPKELSSVYFFAQTLSAAVHDTTFVWMLRFSSN